MDATISRFQRGVEDLLSSCTSDGVVRDVNSNSNSNSNPNPNPNTNPCHDEVPDLNTDEIEKQLSVLLKELYQIQKHNAHYTGSDSTLSCRPTSTMKSSRDKFDKFHCGKENSNRGNDNDNGGSDENNDDNDSDDDNDFIRTTMKYNNKRKKISLRDLLQNSDLAFELSELMSHRNCVDDDDDNDDDNNKHTSESWTVSTTALMAGRLFVELSAMSGSWGIGWIDVGIMRNLEALVRRWGDECKGQKKVGGRKSDASNSSRSRSASLSSEGMLEIPTSIPLASSDNQSTRRDPSLRRSIKRSRTQRIDDDDFQSANDIGNKKKSSRDNSYRSSDFVESAWSLNHGSLKMYGLQLAHSLSNALSNAEYVNWSKDARDAILDASISAFGISCALSISPLSTSRKGAEKNTRTNEQEVEYSSDLIKVLGDAIKMCIVNYSRPKATPSSYDLDDNDSPVAPSTATSPSEEIVVLFLRGFYPLLTCQVDLPNGFRGKAAAFTFASSLTVDVLKHLSKSIDHQLFIGKMTPKRGGQDKNGINKTPNASAPQSCKKTPRSRRKSFLSPSLKKSVTPRRKFRLEQRENDNPRQSREVLDIFVGLMQKISTSKGMEKIDVRARISDFVKKCLFELPHEPREIFLRFLVKLCHSKVSTHRIFGVELIGNFLSTDWVLESLYYSAGGSDKSATDSVIFDGNNTIGSLAEDVNITKAMLCALHGRINDSAPAVRTRATVALSVFLKSYNLAEPPVVQQLISSFKPMCIATLRKRLKFDDKSAVRRASIVALVELFLIHDEVSGEYCLTEDDVTVLCQLCNDSSIGVRKAAIDAIVLLIEKQHRGIRSSDEGRQECLEMLEAAWANAILPLIHDIEVSCTNRVVESFASLIIDPIVKNESEDITRDDVYNTSRYNSAWRILSGIIAASSSTGSFKGGKNAIGTALQKFLEGASASGACVTLLKILHGNIVSGVEDMTAANDEYLCDQFVGSWCLLESVISVHCATKTGTKEFNLEKEIKSSLIGTDFLVECWEGVSQISFDSLKSRQKIQVIAITKSCLSIVAAFAPLMLEQEASSLSDSLRKYLRSFRPGIDLIGSSILALVQITSRLYSDRALAVKSCKEWIKELYDVCEGVLDQFISEGADSSKLDKALYAIGELSMIGFHPSEELSVSKGKKRTHEVNNDSMIGLYVKSPSCIVNLVQSLLLPTLPSTDESIETRTIPSKLRAHAFATFGKICLRDENLARDSINIFARELRQDGIHSDPAVKSNALLVLGDFVVRYTHHVDKFLPLMASCLQLSGSVPTLPSIFSLNNASESIVRHHAILILSNLVLKDYIKWRGILFYRFLAATVDEDPSVASLARLFLCGPLLSKQSTLFFNNFVDSLFILNGCAAHPMFTSRNHRESLRFQAEGLDVFIIQDNEKRKEIYSFLLDHLSPEEKIGVTARLSKEVLYAATAITGELGSAARSSGTQSLNGGAYAVLSDCLEVLTSPQMFVGRSSTAMDDADVNTSMLEASTGGSGPTTTSSRLSSAKGKLLSKISRKQLVETVLPILSTLKTTLEKSHSPLLKNLMRYLVCIFSQFKKEVNDTLASDQTLLQEIKYDMRRQSQVHGR